MAFLRTVRNLFSIAELRKKVLFTLGVLIVYRIGCHIPVVGVDTAGLASMMEGATNLSKLLGYFDVFSGGALARCTVFALGIGPYITASIMMQVLGFSIPHLEQLMKEGEYGRKTINEYTRYLALGLGLFYSCMYVIPLEMQGLVLFPGWAFRIVFVLSLTAGCMTVMWLGEQISLFGMSSGSSMIIFASIVARFPGYVIKTIQYARDGILYTGGLPGLNWLVGVGIWLFLCVITLCIIFLEKGERKIPVQYARRIIGNRVYGGQNSFIPFKIQNAGVMPVIFASTFMTIPGAFAGMLSYKWAILGDVSRSLTTQSGFFFNFFQFFLIVFFYFMYTSMMFDPKDLAENLKKGGGFIPGIRPGKQTADFFDLVLTRLGLVGSMYLAGLAALPNLMVFAIGMGSMPFFLGGTSLLIVVGVGLETASQLEAYLVEHNYEGFLASGKIKARGLR